MLIIITKTLVVVIILPIFVLNNNHMEKDARLKLQMRILEAKAKLPRNYMDVYEFLFGEQSIENKYKIRNVYRMDSTDESIIKNFELMAKKSKLVK